VTRHDIETLGQFGTLDYYPDFPRPFFRVLTDNGAQIKGVQDELSFLVIYPKGQVEKVKEDFEKFFRFAPESAD